MEKGRSGRFLMAAVLALSLLATVRPVGAGHHYHHKPRPSPWLDRRPTTKARPGRDLRVRPFLHWPRPCYLDLAPVVFPGPPPPLKPLFAPAAR